MTAQRNQQQLFHIPRAASGGDAFERTLAQVSERATQDVVPADGRELPQALQPDMHRDAPAPSIAEQGARRNHQAGQYEDTDRAALSRMVSIVDVVTAAGFMGRGRTPTCPKCGKEEMSVRASSNTAHCFRPSCEVKSYDPVRWYMNLEGYTLPEVNALIRGLPMPSGRKAQRVIPALLPARAEEPALQQRPFTPLYLAARDAFWAQDTPAAESALTYMLSRGFNGDELEQMGIGVADSTVPEVLLPLKADGRVNQSWRDRIIIPTLEGNQAVNLKARSQKADAGKYKYLNPTGGKATLVGLEELGGKVPDDVLLVEGELDYWSARFLLPGRAVLAVRGLENLSAARASLFTCCRVFVMLDGDTYGRRLLTGDLAGKTDAEATEILKGEGRKFGAALAGHRLVHRLRDAGADPWVCEMPGDGDLNDILKAFQDDREAGSRLLEHAIQDAQPLYRRRILY